MTRPWRILRALLLCRPAARLPMEQWAHVRRVVLIRDSDTCRCRRWLGWGRECGRAEVDMHVDHVLPVAWGGTSDASNLRCACAPCNLRKGARPPLGWLLRRIARQSALYAALGYLAVATWYALPDAPAATVRDSLTVPAAADTGQRWAVVAPGGQVVAAFDDRGVAERAAAGWNAAGGAGRLGVAGVP